MSLFSLFRLLSSFTFKCHSKKNNVFHRFSFFFTFVFGVFLFLFFSSWFLLELKTSTVLYKWHLPHISGNKSQVFREENEETDITSHHLLNYHRNDSVTRVNDSWNVVNNIHNRVVDFRTIQLHLPFDERSPTNNFLSQRIFISVQF